VKGKSYFVQVMANNDAIIDYDANSRSTLV